MSSSIFLLQENGQLLEMAEQPYDSEQLLQNLLEKYPLLLAGDQINETEPRRWLLIACECPLPSRNDGGARWSVDHLFVDQQAIPTIVEVKRSSNSEIRRQIVGQMLEYAANAVAYWSVESLRARFEVKPNWEQTFTDFLGVENSQEQFWDKVRSNLEAGKVRLLFVADRIPPELRRIVEFLNRQMDPAEVLAVEVRQYVGEGSITLVPRVIGKVKEAQPKQTPRQWDKTSFFRELESRCGREDARSARNLLDWGIDSGLRVWWGKGTTDGSFYLMLDYCEKVFWTISVWTNGRILVPRTDIRKQPPFSEGSSWNALVSRLEQIHGVAFPSFPISALNDVSAFQQFTATLDWMVGLYKNG